MSWYRAPLWDFQPDITSCSNVAVWNLRSCFCWVPCLTGGRVCNLQCNHSMVRVAQNPKSCFTVSFESPPAWRARWGEVTLRLTVSQYVLVSSTLVGLATRYYLLSEICGLVSLRRPLWREDGPAVCSAITHWSESRRTRNHTLLSHLRLPQPGGPGSRIYIPQKQGDPVIPPSTG
jgi:hypothetical protein